MLSSWLARVACRYGLTAQELAGYFPAGQSPAPPRPIDDSTPAADQTREWAAACGVDPERLRRLSLSRRYPRRPRSWYATRGPEWALSIGSPPVCAACFDDDHAAGRDAYLRAHWELAELCVCPRHGRQLHDRCGRCHRPLSLGFRMRGGCARPVCNHCEGVFTNRGGEGAQPHDPALAGSVLAVQAWITAGIDRADSERERFERALATLWAPLDHPAAARPVLALWFNEAGWRCPYDVRHAVGVNAPLGRLPVRWRFLTLLALNDTFGGDLRGDGGMPPPAAHLMRRAAPRRERLSRPSRDGRMSSHKSAPQPNTSAWRVKFWLIRAGLQPKAAPATAGARSGTMLGESHNDARDFVRAAICVDCGTLLDKRGHSRLTSGNGPQTRSAQ
ncbi:hypothetical protein Nham_4581 (plasmid) [Nitrobacter hamburgensis X14]|uniref:TniQ domain-containing protein n=1 Tax=Nitrobacter hamburgensis (strain DSM 10229 / NCIMB 13809 / X14) TaxID=323097 RepID=Q1QF41_NITHX|nr:hypothetical protein Nham_4581 [Nitrobacter hamburgensis X14]